jgi:hypothetical protein
MSVETNQVSDQTSDSSGTPSTKDSVAYETYRKAIGEVKSFKAKISEYEAREAEREQAVLAEQGKYKEALESERKKV